MNGRNYISCAVAAFIVLGSARAVRAADVTDGPDVQTSRQQLREKLKDMTPEERQAAIRKWREEHAGAGALREKLRKRREQVKNLTPEQRKTRRKEVRAQMEKRLDKLKEKQADGTLNDREKQRLERVMTRTSRQPAPGNQGAKPSEDGKPLEK